MRSTKFQLFILTVGAGLVGCSGSSGGTGSGAGGDQGVGGTNGGTVGVGGAPVTGGVTAAGPTGGANASPTGGANASPTGGANAGPTGGANAVPTGGVNAGPTGGANAGPTGGANATGGNVATGGANIGNPTGGASPGVGGSTSATGGKASGGAPTTGTGGKVTGGSTSVGTGGMATGGKATGGTPATTGGAPATGGATSTGTVTGPCDIYAAASPATPCVAAYSTTRVLYSKYTGALYQVRKGSTVQDIGVVAGTGFADGNAQDTFCGTSACTISILYDQSGRKNDLKVAPAGCYTGTASQADYESNAKGKSTTLSGHKVYALYMIPQDGYRNDTPSGMPTGSAAQGIYEIADGTRIGSACCWDFGNASVNNCNQGTMNAMYFGTGYWGKGTGNGPWFMADLEGGVWAGGTGASNVVNNNLPSSNVPFAFGILKTSTSNYVIRVGNAQSGTLTTANNTGLPKTLNSPGGIILGIGGDNSNSSLGTFFEGAITAGQPSDTTDAAVLANVQAVQYGQ